MSTLHHRADRFLEPGSDPREGSPRLGDEQATLTEFLRGQRLMLQLKCGGLNPEQLARQAVEPSTMSLLGLVRHMAEVERGWFRRRFAGHDVPRRYQTGGRPRRRLQRGGRRPVRGRRGVGGRSARRSSSPSSSPATTTSASPAATRRGANLAARAARAMIEGVRPPQRARRRAPRAHRRTHRPVTATPMCQTPAPPLAAYPPRCAEAHRHRPPRAGEHITSPAQTRRSHTPDPVTTDVLHGTIRSHAEKRMLYSQVICPINMSGRVR